MLKSLGIIKGVRRARTNLINCERGNLITRRALIIPQVIESTTRGEQVWDLYSKLLKERIICLMHPIDDNIASLIISQMLYLEHDNNKKPIQLYINSPGGSVSSAMAIYDTMQFVQSEVHTIGIGMAASGASLLLGAGTKGHRYSLPHTRIMLHQPLVHNIGGQATEIEIQAREILKIREILENIYISHTSQDKLAVSKVLERDTWMSAHDALAFGLIDKIVSKNI